MPLRAYLSMSIRAYKTVIFGPTPVWALDNVVFMDFLNLSIKKARGRQTPRLRNHSPLVYLELIRIADKLLITSAILTYPGQKRIPMTGFG